MQKVYGCAGLFPFRVIDSKCPDDEFRNGMSLGFHVDMTEMSVDGMDGNIQFIGDDLPAFTFCYSSGNFPFPSAERGGCS
jgi:hypothetical protein